ncbi:MAG TPA: helix-turn-helix transcriptional regulator, partial [Thermomicrobiales bacterium]|nr:helix-turn-helix transcriptional regulator [Thermomicrobiales bacterium]
MDENELLVLGLLRLQDQHGYRINEFVDSNLGRLTTMKRPTAYATLDRLHRQGCVAVRAEQIGNRTPRKVYAITPAGEARFQALLRANLAAPPLTSTTEIGLLFLDGLPPDDVAACLAARLDHLDALIATHEQAPEQASPLGVDLAGVDLALDHFVAMLRAERTWLADAL